MTWPDRAVLRDVRSGRGQDTYRADGDAGHRQCSGLLCKIPLIRIVNTKTYFYDGIDG